MADKDADQIRKRKTRAIFIIFPVVVVLGALIIFFYLQYKKTHISTQDAYVDGRIHTVASKVSGTVQKLYVKDNQAVKTGDPLLDLDPADYQVKLEAARAELENEKAKLAQILSRVATVKSQFSQSIASLDAARSNLKAQEANLNQADTNLKRAEALLKGAVIPQQQYDQTKTNYDVSSLQVKASADHVREMAASVETQKALIKETEAGIPTQEESIKEKEEDLRQAELNLSYTKIVAPADGYVTKRTVEIGNQVQPNQPLMAVVPLDDQEEIWITANYKETEFNQCQTWPKGRDRSRYLPGKKIHRQSG